MATAKQIAASKRNLAKARAARSKASSKEHPMSSKDAPGKQNSGVSAPAMKGVKVRGVTMGGSAATTAKEFSETIKILQGIQKRAGKKVSKAPTVRKRKDGSVTVTSSGRSIRLKD